ncbi:MAG: zinc-dependent metalloprotease [Bacteroidota bacterium]
MKYLKVLLLLCVPAILFAQGPIFQKINKASITAKAETPNYQLVQHTSTVLEDHGVSKSELEEGVLVDLDFTAIKQLQNQKPNLLKLQFPLPQLGNVQMTLMPNKIFTPDFILQASSSPGVAVDYRPGAYYFGVLDADPNSLVAISVFDNEIIGMINTDHGNYVIGKLKGQITNTHIIYNDLSLKSKAGLECGTPDDGVVYEPGQLSFNAPEDVGDCIRVYIEIDDDIVSNKGGVTGATNYITGMFNESITLYANESLDMAISEIKAWDTPAPYSGGSSGAMLNSYQANTGAFNGDLSHLVSYQASGGIAAGFSGICNSNVDNSKCFSSVSSTYSTVPTYSFSVMVVTHEMGHLIGSRHTHACVWNGNGTAIDGCAGGTEGSCSVPGSPSGGGTIMSYCHLTTGIDFTQGFGPQPGNVIRNTVANASCLSTCGGSAPTCTDGIQNGQETGVDCGGPVCPPCNSTCEENEVVVTINLDNYPEETSWDVKNSNGTTVASGGTYPNNPDGSTVSETLCLADGCFDFTIYDAYGDGICCGYGNGSYTVTSGGTTLASGGAFTSSETTNFCLGAPAGPTCDDGIQNGQETGVDCGGPDCDPCPTSGVLLASFFETGWDGWTDGGSDCYRYSGSRSYEGSYSIRIRDNSGTASAMTSQTLDVSNYSAVEVNFYFYPNSMETGEDFWVRYFDGASWSTVATYTSGSSFTNNSFYVATVTVNSSQYNFPSNAQFRFQCDASGNADRVYIDQVTITGIAGSLVEGETIVTIEEVEQATSPFDYALRNTAPVKGTKVFPNPANDVLNLATDRNIENIQIISHTGQVLRIIQSTDQNQELTIADLQPGIYYLLIQTDGEFIPKKFIKL